MAGRVDAERSPTIGLNQYGLEADEEPAGTSKFVFLCSGEVRIVPRVTSVCLDNSLVLLFCNELLAASFPRANVYFCSNEGACPPILF